MESWRILRLSKDDELTGESASISNQRDILVNYCQSQLAGGGCVSRRWLYRIEYRPTGLAETSQSL